MKSDRIGGHFSKRTEGISETSFVDFQSELDH